MSCLPDEVRERDYEMDLFDAPRQLKKIPSPIKHLLRYDAKPTDPLPKPTWGAPNAPPLVGAVHCRERESNVSPRSTFFIFLNKISSSYILCSLFSPFSVGPSQGLCCYRHQLENFALVSQPISNSTVGVLIDELSSLFPTVSN